MTALVRHLSLNNNLHPRPSGFATITGAPTLGPGSGPPQPSPSNANIQPEVCLHSLGHTRLLPASTAMADNPGVGQGVYLDGSGVLLNAKLTNQPQTSVITYNGLVKSFGSEGLERRIEPNPSQGSVLTPLGYVSGHDASCISVQITKSTGASVVLLLIVIWKMDSFIDLEGRSFDLILCKDYLDISPDRIQAGFQNQTVPNIQGDGHNALTLGTNHFSNQLGNVNNSPLPDAIMRDQASGVVPGYIIPRYPAYAIPPATYFPDTGNNPAPGFTSPMPPVSMPGYPPQIGASDISSTSASNNFLTQAPAGGMRTPGLQSPQQWEGYSNGTCSLTVRNVCMA